MPLSAGGEQGDTAQAGQEMEVLLERGIVSAAQVCWPARSPGASGGPDA
jgi:hypothetical protein